MSAETSTELIASFPLSCEGIFDGDSTPLKNKPTQATVVAYKNGEVSIGCSYLGDGGICLASPTKAESLRCAHLRHALSASENKIATKLPSIESIEDISLEHLTSPVYLIRLLEVLYQPWLDTSEDRVVNMRGINTIVANAGEDARKAASELGGYPQREIVYIANVRKEVYEVSKSLHYYISMDDGKLRAMRNFGDKCLSVFREATNPVKDKFNL